MLHVQSLGGEASRRWSRIVMGLVAAALLLALPVTASAATFTVMATTDAPDDDLLDGDCDTAGLTVACTLRAAIQQANASAGADVIEFSIGGPGVRTISAGPLPPITDELVIDGFTQKYSTPNTATTGTDADLRVAVNGGGSGVGLDIQAAYVTIKGLIVQDFGDGIRVGAPGAVIVGNFVGTDAAGTGNAANTRNGIVVDAADARIGGRLPAERNLVSANSGDGIRLLAGAENATIQGNLVGTARDGRTPLGNGGDGIEANGAQGALIGGDTAAKANVIRSNDGAGVAVTVSGTTQPSGIRILRNVLFANVGLGIDRPAGPPSRPVLASAVSSSTKTTIKGRVSGPARRSFVVQLFSNTGGDEAQSYLGQKTVTTDSSGRATFTFTPGSRVAPGRYITATSTDQVTADTSEIAARKKVIRP